MNGENVEHWMSTQLLPNLEEPSVIVMDNASYHNVHVEKSPTQSWRKDEIIAWLQEKGIPFAEGLFKAESLNLAIVNTSSKKRYTISLIVISPPNRLFLVYRLWLSSALFTTMP
jgi:hypothetical protein